MVGCAQGCTRRRLLVCEGWFLRPQAQPGVFELHNGIACSWPTCCCCCALVPSTCHAVTWHHSRPWPFPCPQTRRPDETAQQFAERVQRMIAGECCGALAAAGGAWRAPLALSSRYWRPALSAAQLYLALYQLVPRTRPERLLLPGVCCCRCAALLPVTPAALDCLLRRRQGAAACGALGWLPQILQPWRQGELCTHQSFDP